MQSDVDTETVHTSLLHPCGPSKSFKYPSKEDILDIPITSVLTKVNPRTVTGRTYTLTKQ